MHFQSIARPLATLAFILAALPALAATPSTSTGRISVAQVMAMLDEAGSNGVAAQVLEAYLGGLGETAGVLVSSLDAEGQPYVTCDRTLALDAAIVRTALRNAVPDRAKWAEAPATPLVVDALIHQAGCR